MTLFPVSKVVGMKHLFTIGVLLSAIFPAQAQFGSIRGVVVNEEGNPVKEARVIATDSMDEMPMRSRLPKLHLTDDTGHFAISGLQFDDYVVTAYKEDEDYPELVGTWLLFYKKPAEPRVKLTAQNPAATVEIRLGPKAGVLVCTITAANTGATVHACAAFKAASASDFNTAYPVPSHYRLLIPADADVNLKVWWDGYRPWYYPGTDQNVAGTSIRLKPGEEKG